MAIRRHAQRNHFHFYSRCSSWTFVQNVSAKPISWRAEHWVLGGVALLLTALVGIVIPGWANATRHDPAPAALTTLSLAVPQLAPGTEADPTIGAYGIGANAEPDWHRVTVRAGQSLADIFHENNLSPADLQRALNSQDDASALRHIHPGDEFAFVTDANGALTLMRFDRGDAARVTLAFTPDGVTESVDERAIERRTQIAHGVLTRSLYEAGASAGMSDTMIWKLANAFGYDIDFAQDLREGDSFSVIYDDVYREGEHLHDGDIIAATFINQGKRYTA
ncbi:MAG: LysM-like peptidoglycan-binding domain-containing protein, partial [Rhodanobacteraceae bacterium]